MGSYCGACLDAAGAHPLSCRLGARRWLRSHCCVRVVDSTACARMLSAINRVCAGLGWWLKSFSVPGTASATPRTFTSVQAVSAHTHQAPSIYVLGTCLPSEYGGCGGCRLAGAVSLSSSSRSSTWSEPATRTTSRAPSSGRPQRAVLRCMRWQVVVMTGSTYDSDEAAMKPAYGTTAARLSSGQSVC